VLIRRVQLTLAASGATPTVDVRLASGRIVQIEPGLVPEADEPVVDGEGAALLPGLHDHHIHLLSLAAARQSVRCGPPARSDEASLARALQAAAEQAHDGDWIRGVGYHESVAGDLDAARLDALTGSRPVRVQHRSGAMWIVNGAGLERLGLRNGAGGRAPEDTVPGVELRADGRATGRIYRADAWLRERIGPTSPPDLSDVGTTLARFGVTGVTDATPHNGSAELALISRATAAGALPQRVRLMGTPELPEPQQPGVSRGAVKLVLSEYEPPAFDELEKTIESAHEAQRNVAIHCVTRAELAFAVAAFTAAGVLRGDRIEHASIAPPDLATRLAELGLWVVTQPNFVRERGDAYLADVDANDQPWLYRCQGLLDAGIALGGSTDAPFGDPDPWLAMQAALDRRTAAGADLGPSEALTPERALSLFTTPADAPGAEPRRLVVGAAADLCLLDRPWVDVRDVLDSAHVAGTWVSGRPVWHRS
jgi:predicted amidohydrolase YtcJ